MIWTVYEQYLNSKNLRRTLENYDERKNNNSREHSGIHGNNIITFIELENFLYKDYREHEFEIKHDSQQFWEIIRFG